MVKTLFLASVWKRGFYAVNYFAQVSEKVLPLGQVALVTWGVLSPAKHILTITLIQLLWEISRISKATDNLKVRIRALSEKTLENEEHPEWLIPLCPAFLSWVSIAPYPVKLLHCCTDRKGCNKGTQVGVGHYLINEILVCRGLQKLHDTPSTVWQEWGPCQASTTGGVKSANISQFFFLSSGVTPFSREFSFNCSILTDVLKFLQEQRDTSSVSHWQENSSVVTFSFCEDIEWETINPAGVA